MIKVTLYDRKYQKTIDIFTQLSSFKFYRKISRNDRFIFLAWSSKKRNYNCWHWCVGDR